MKNNVHFNVFSKQKIDNINNKNNSAKIEV